MEGEDAAGHRGQEEGEAETESKCSQAPAGPGLRATGGYVVGVWTEDFLRPPQLPGSGRKGRFWRGGGTSQGLTQQLARAQIAIG